MLHQSMIWSAPLDFVPTTGVLVARIGDKHFAILKNGGWTVLNVRDWEHRYHTPIPACVYASDKPGWCIVAKLSARHRSNAVRSRKFTVHTLDAALESGINTFKMIMTRGKTAQPLPFRAARIL